MLNNLGRKETQISVVEFKNINDKENSQNIDRNWINEDEKHREHYKT